MPAMASSPSTVIACAALLVSGCAIGLLLGRWTSSPPPPSDHESAVVLPQTDLAPLLTEIKQSNEAVLLALRDRRNPESQSGSSRESATANPDVIQNLTAAVDKLNGLLERGTIGAGASRVTGDFTKGSGYPSLSAVWQKIDSITSPDDPDWQSKAETELTRAHLLWTIEDLIVRYGAGTQTGTSGATVTMGYNRSMEANRANSIGFLLGNGVIIRVYVR